MRKRLSLVLGLAFGLTCLFQSTAHALVNWGFCISANDSDCYDENLAFGQTESFDILGTFTNHSSSTSNLYGYDFRRLGGLSGVPTVINPPLRETWQFYDLSYTRPGDPLNFDAIYANWNFVLEPGESAKVYYGTLTPLTEPRAYNDIKYGPWQTPIPQGVYNTSYEALGVLRTFERNPCWQAGGNFDTCRNVSTDFAQIGRDYAWGAPFQHNVVPEPSSFILLGMGVLGAGFASRRKKKAAVSA